MADAGAEAARIRRRGPDRVAGGPCLWRSHSHLRRAVHGAIVHRSKRRLPPEFDKIDGPQRVSAWAHERSECVGALERDQERWSPVFRSDCIGTGL